MLEGVDVVECEAVAALACLSINLRDCLSTLLRRRKRVSIQKGFSGIFKVTLLLLLLLFCVWVQRTERSFLTLFLFRLFERHAKRAYLSLIHAFFNQTILLPTCLYYRPNIAHLSPSYSLFTHTHNSRTSVSVFNSHHSTYFSNHLLSSPSPILQFLLTTHIISLTMSTPSTTPSEPIPDSVHEAEAPDALGDVELDDIDKAAYVRMFLSVDDTAEGAKEALELGEFPYDSDTLIDHTRLTLLKLWVRRDYSVLSETSFHFLGATIGPLDRHTFIEALDRYDFEAGFPDCTYGVHNLWIDPHRPNRVFFVSSFRGTHNGVGFGDNIKPTNNSVRSPPQVSSLTFDNDGKVTRMTSGYVVDRAEGNTGGLGAVLGMLYAIGKPLPVPEGHPFQPSWQMKMASFVDGIVKNLTKGTNGNKKVIKPAEKKEEEGGVIDGEEVAEE